MCTEIATYILCPSCAKILTKQTNYSRPCTEVNSSCASSSASSSSASSSAAGRPGSITRGNTITTTSSTTPTTVKRGRSRHDSVISYASSSSSSSASASVAVVVGYGNCREGLWEEKRRLMAGSPCGFCRWMAWLAARRRLIGVDFWAVGEKGTGVESEGKDGAGEMKDDGEAGKML